MRQNLSNQPQLFDPKTGGVSLLALIGHTPPAVRTFEVRPETISGGVGPSSFFQLREGGTWLEYKRIFARRLTGHLGDWRTKSPGWELAEILEHVGRGIVSLEWIDVDDEDLINA